MWTGGQAPVLDGGPQLQRSPPFEDWSTSPKPETSRSVPERGMEKPTYDLSRLRSSSVEIREKGSEILREELLKAQKELKLRDEECERLSKVREQLEQELEELTASLFEEAHKMVREANMKQAASEKQLREAHGKIDMLQAEVSALKTLVITSTPSSPNRELHPQLQSPSKNALRKGHARNKSAGCAAVVPAALPAQPINTEGKEVDNLLYSEFLGWKENPTLDKSSPFLLRIYEEDITPCLDFAKRELAEQVLAAVEDNTLSVEPVVQPTLPVVKASAVERGGPSGCRVEVLTKCALSGLSRSCRHRIKLGDSGNYYFISPSCRARITAVCNFFTYIRYIQQGLVRQDTELIFWEITRLRREMSVAKLGFYVIES
ncbi:guanine nucleotide exchange factor for Rab-3A isoform X1 [Rana temporaria]|uniref:guanine nucleotide exchange factor for Rab-3A isoform X1 n=2 Tax=Rana temporaria TaxID=8407 RepID=UPI001AACFACE|nr:guanine nucleotide exchange factor for Rab-3A isoform X1 [Rana temporaria]